MADVHTHTHARTHLHSVVVKTVTQAQQVTFSLKWLRHYSNNVLSFMEAKEGSFVPA